MEKIGNVLANSVKYFYIYPVRGNILYRQLRYTILPPSIFYIAPGDIKHFIYKPLKHDTVMPFWKKSFSKARGVYYPRAIVQGNPVETETIAKDLARISTVSNSDVQAVLGDIAPVMHARMAQGKSVHIKGLGYFRYVLDTTGVASLEDFDFQKQVKAVRVEFIPERTRTASGTYTRALVDSDQLEWIELAPNTEEQDPAEDDDEGQTENPLG